MLMQKRDVKGGLFGLFYNAGLRYDDQLMSSGRLIYQFHFRYVTSGLVIGTWFPWLILCLWPVIVPWSLIHHVYMLSSHYHCIQIPPEVFYHINKTIVHMSLCRWLYGQQLFRIAQRIHVLWRIAYSLFSGRPSLAGRIDGSLCDQRLFRITQRIYVVLRIVFVCCSAVNYC